MDDARAKVGDGGMPKARLGFLRLGGKEIEIVDAEDIKLLEEEHHLRLGDGHEIAWRESSERGGITLGETEEMLKLNDKGGIDNLAHAISMIVRLFLYGERTVGENDHSLAAVALADHLGVGRTLEEVKLGVGDNLLKVVASHSHKERQLEQWGKSYQLAILSFMDGENHTLLVPSSLARMKYAISSGWRESTDFAFSSPITMNAVA